MIILLILALTSPYSPWRRAQLAEGAAEEAILEKGGLGGAGNPAFNNTMGGAGPGALGVGVNEMQANGGPGAIGAAGAPSQMNGGVMYPQMGFQQPYMQQQQSGFTAAPVLQQSGVNNAPYVPVGISSSLNSLNNTEKRPTDVCSSTTSA